jgi:outer membrane receptor protein involved in Fe transport
MKKNLLRQVKMAAFYSFWGILVQSIIVSMLFALPSEGQDLRNVRLNVNISNLYFEDALKYLENKTDFKFLYIQNELPLKEKVTIDVTNESLYEILKTLASDYNLLFQRINNQIVIKKDESAEKKFIEVLESNGGIKGKVTDGKSGEAVIGATIVVKGTTKGAYTDLKGFFSIDDLKPGRYSVTVSCVGYSATKKTVQVTEDKFAEIHFELGQSAVNLDEVIVTGSISERSIRESANPITVITPKELENRDLSSLNAVFQNVPGIVISSTNDVVSQGGRMLDQTISELKIRGAGTAYDAKIKVIIDGVEMADANMLTFIDPEQIEKIEVARGPMSSTLYGAGSSEGIIQIFTKRGLGKLSAHLKTTFTSQESKYQDSNPLNSQYSLFLIGAKGDMAYNFGVNYARFPISRWKTNNGIDEEDWAFSAGVSGKIENISADLKVMKGISLAGSGDINQYYRIAVEQGWSNPNSSYISSPYSDIRYKGKQLITSLNLKQPIRENLYHNLNVSFSQMNQFQNYYSGTKYSDGSYSYLTINTDYSITNAKYFINWKEPVSEFFKIDFTAGFDISDGIINSTRNRYTTPFDDDVRLVGNPRSVVSEGGTMTSDTKALYAEGVWGFWNNLFFTTGYRTETNNSYGDNSGWNPIPRVGATYVAEFGSFTVKPRISWGESTKPVSAMFKADRITNAGSVVIIQVGNPNLKPQKQTGWEFGGDLFFESNYSINITYYTQKIVDMVLQQDIPDPTVFKKFTYTNISQVHNKGLEISSRIIYDPFTLDIAYTHLKSTYGSGFPKVSASANPEFHEGGKVISIPTGSFVAKLAYTMPALLPWSSRGGNLTVEYIRNGEEYNQDYMFYYRTIVETGKGGYKFMDFPGYSRINLRLDYAVFNDIILFFDIQNALNNQEMLYSGPLRGRISSFGLNYKL